MSAFWKQTLEAAGWTFLQVFIVTFGASLAGLATFDWGTLSAAAIAAALAGIGAALSIFKSIAVRKVGVEDTTLIT